MNNSNYNGWTNKETWLVHLWLSNNPADYESMINAESADEIKQLVDEYRDFTVDDAANLFTDLITTGLSRVDWYEIYDKTRED